MIKNDIQMPLMERVVVGLSAIVGVTGNPLQNGMLVKYFSGGSLEIGGTYVLVAGASTAFTWGNGYLMGSAEALSFNGIGSVYLAASGATVTAMVLRGLSPGLP